MATKKSQTANQLFSPDQLLASMAIQGLNRRRVAERAKKSPLTVRRVLAGRNVTLSTLRRVAGVLGCKVKIEIERAA